jgi:hypothetical protein
MSRSISYYDHSVRKYPQYMVNNANLDSFDKDFHSTRGTKQGESIGEAIDHIVQQLHRLGDNREPV